MLVQVKQLTTESNLPIQPLIRQNLALSAFKRRFYRGFTISSVSLDSIHSYFLWLSIRNALEFALSEFGANIEGTTSEIIKYTTIPFVLANLVCDVTSVDPLREADELAIASHSVTSSQETSKRLLGLLLKIIAMTSSYSVEASVDAVSVANLTKNMSSEKAATIINYTTLVITISLGVIYYSMLTNSQIQNHANEFIDLFKQPRAFINNYKKNSLAYIEVAIQSLFTSAYKSVYFGYVMSTFLSTFIEANISNRTIRGSILTTAATTFLITLFSRTLSVRDKFINPDFTSIDANTLKRATSWHPELISDSLLTIIRSGAASVLIYNAVPGTKTKYGISILVGSIAALHSGYVRYKTRLYNNALQIMSPANLSVTTNNDEEMPLLATASAASIQEGLQPIEKFDAMSKQFLTHSMQRNITGLNIMMNFARITGFFWFIAALNESLDMGLTQIEIITLTFLWGAEVFKNSMAFYDDQLRSVWSSIAAKVYIEQAKDEQKLPETSRRGYRGSFFHYAKAFVKSPYDYTEDELHVAETKLSIN